MKVACIQMNMLLSQPEENFAHAEQLVRQAAAFSPDVIVLPETWNTGFFPKNDLPSLCDNDGERTKAVFGALARELNVNIVAGSVSDLHGGKIYNTAYIFDRSGSCAASYDKTHLFSPMGEHESYEKGGRLCRFELDGVKCGIIICYDLRFPELIRSLALEGMDVLFVVSQWPAARNTHLQTLTAARAIENQIFLACCNSCGVAESTVYGGSSVLLDPLGQTLAHAGDKEEIISAEFDIGTIQQIRGSIPVFEDRRPELYHL